MSGFGRFSLPLARSFETAAGPIDRRQGFLIRLGDGPIGIGEATPLAGWTEPLEACHEAIEDGLEAADALTAADEVPTMASTPAARHGLELAVLDRAARGAGEPLYRRLGGAHRVSTVPVNATVRDGDVEATVAACRAATDDGFGAIKLKVGARAVEEDLGRVAAVSEAVDRQVELRVDANGAWTPDQAATAIAELADLGVSIVEQPLGSDELAAHAELRGRGVDIALDESLQEHAVEAVLDAAAADVLVLKPMVLGGVGRAKRFGERARDAGVDVVVTTTIDAAVARTAAVHLAAALDVARACGLATASWLVRDVASDPAIVVDGGISVPQGAGHGVGVEELE